VKIFLGLLPFLFSCSSVGLQGSPKETKQQYSYIDGSGKFVLSREHKLLKNKLISRTQIASNQGSSLKILEKSITVSQMGTIKDKNSRILILRPLASEFTVWLEGKRYDSKMRLDLKKKSMSIELNSPEPKWQGMSSVPVPQGKQFCFFSQIPDCLYHNMLLSKAMARKDESFPFYVIWEGYPFIQDQFTGVGSKLFEPANVKFNGEQKNTMRFLIEVGGQSILYHFSKSFDLVRMFWVAQGVTVVPPSEAAAEVEE
jgi:hypothetical protein